MEPTTVDFPVGLVFEPAELNIVIKSLEEQPHRLVGALIQNIHAQVMKQLLERKRALEQADAAPPPPPTSPPVKKGKNGKSVGAG